MADFGWKAEERGLLLGLGGGHVGHLVLVGAGAGGLFGFGGTFLEHLG